MRMTGGSHASVPRKKSKRGERWLSTRADRSGRPSWAGPAGQKRKEEESPARKRKKNPAEKKEKEKGRKKTFENHDNNF